MFRRHLEWNIRDAKIWAVILCSIILPFALNKAADGRIFLGVMRASCQNLGYLCHLEVPILVDIQRVHYNWDISGLDIFIQVSNERELPKEFISVIKKRASHIVHDKSNADAELYVHFYESTWPGHPRLEGYGKSKYFATIIFDILGEDDRDELIRNEIWYNCFSEYATEDVCIRIFLDDYVDRTINGKKLNTGVVFKEFRLD